MEVCAGRSPQPGQVEGTDQAPLRLAGRWRGRWSAGRRPERTSQGAPGPPARPAPSRPWRRVRGGPADQTRGLQAAPPPGPPTGTSPASHTRPGRDPSCLSPVSRWRATSAETSAPRNTSSLFLTAGDPPAWGDRWSRLLQVRWYTTLTQSKGDSFNLESSVKFNTIY